MSAIPQSVLSEHFQERMQGRRLVSAVFTTFRFEPAFFETEILPVFFDIPLSHATPIKLIQLREAIGSLKGTIAVYYDQHGLSPDGGAAKLDTRRIPIHHPTGIFHPKNVFALVEAVEPDENGHHAQALLCACASANLTRAGWWENVEVAHVEEIPEGDHTALKDALEGYLDALVSASERRRANDELRAGHAAASDVRRFLRGTTQRMHRSVDARLLPHFHDGRSALPEFLESVAGNALQGCALDVISPYFDDGPGTEPLDELIERFAPREVRVFLPRDPSGNALCSEAFFAAVRKKDDVTWAALPRDLLRLGDAAGASQRAVHAKVYRFYEPVRGGREILYVGSANLTGPGFRVTGRGGNWETGFIVEATTSGRPESWLEPDTKRPSDFKPRGEAEGTATQGGTLLMLRYRWDTDEAAACWNGTEPSPSLSVQRGGTLVLELAALPPGAWVPLDKSVAARLRDALLSTSLLEVVEPGKEPAALLVQEEEMWRRPSLLLDLSATDILRYWALLTVEQRIAFVEARAQVAGDDDPLVVRLAPLVHDRTLFDRFAGIFHAFDCLEDRVRTALQTGKTREADYRLFGRTYDSLGNLLERVLTDVESGKGDRVEQYVVVLCAKQLLREVAGVQPDYWRERRAEVRDMESRLQGATALRDDLAATSDEMPGFLDWFDRWFLQRAAAVDAEDSP